jgi:thymidylate synthase
VRPIRLPYCLGLFLWTAAGSDDADWIAYYNPSVRRFSDDMSHFSGAMGRRIMAAGGVNQINAIKNRLLSDRSSRRTVAVISEAVDNTRETREYPCAIALQYLFRQERLVCIAYMRSQSAAVVLPYDAFVFMALQCLLAEELNIGIGSYYHIAGSFHIYQPSALAYPWGKHSS